MSLSFPLVRCEGKAPDDAGYADCSLTCSCPPPSNVRASSLVRVSQLSGLFRRRDWDRCLRSELAGGIDS